MVIIVGILVPALRFPGRILIFVKGIVISNFTNFGFVYGRPELNGKEAQWRIPLGRG